MLHITGPIYLIRGPFFEFPYCHCLLVLDDRCCLIDTAMTGESMGQLTANYHVDLILNTHGHVDHVNQNDKFTQPVYVHPAEKIWMASPEEFLQAFGFTGFGEYKEGLRFMERGRWKPRPPDGYFLPGDIIELGKTRVQVVHLPGHTPGHCGFLFPDEGILFAGDIDLTDFGPFYGNPVANLDDFIHTLDWLIELQPDTIITAHGDGVVTRNIGQRLRDYRNIIFQREEELLANLRWKGKSTLSEIAEWKTVYSKYGYPADGEKLYRMMETIMDHHHLVRLVRIGKVIEDGEYYIAVG